MRPIYEQAKVAVAPLHLGGGTKLKLLEALAMGVPVVTTPGNRVDGADASYLRVGYTNREFAYHVIQLLEDEEKRLEAARAGLTFVRTYYSWQAIIANVATRLRQLFQEEGSKSK